MCAHRRDAFVDQFGVKLKFHVLPVLVGVIGMLTLRRVYRNALCMNFSFQVIPFSSMVIAAALTPYSLARR